MFGNVLVGVDGKPNARDAIALARQLPAADAQLTLAHVHSGELRSLNAVQRELLARTGEVAELLEWERGATGVTAELRSVAALHAGAGLHHQAERQLADLLVVGSCSRGAFGRAMLGDDTRDALNGAPCAVAVAARGYAEKPQPIQDIGVAYNESPESNSALELAEGWQQSSGATVKALEVVSIPSMAFTGIMPPAIGESMDVMVSMATMRMSALPDVDGKSDLRLARGGARRLQPAGRPAHRRLTRLRADEAPDAGQHLQLSRAPRPLLVTGPATPRRERGQPHAGPNRHPRRNKQRYRHRCLDARGASQTIKGMMRCSTTCWSEWTADRAAVTPLRSPQRCSPRRTA